MKKLLPFLFALFILTGCQTTNILREKYTDPQVLPVEDLCPEQINWAPVLQDNQEIPGFSQTQYYVKATNAKWKCVRIDLSTPGLTITAEPKVENLGKHFYLQQFAKKYNTTAAINTTPFDLEGKTYIPISVIKTDDEVICPPVPGYAALCFKQIPDEKDEQKVVLRAQIINSQSQEEIKLYSWAYGGFSTILEGENIYPFEKYKRSRTAAGISEDGSILYLLAACGNNCPTGRNGLNFEECAIILQKMGCYKAMEMDGGHSSGLCINQENSLQPSLQRKVPAAIGFKIKR